MIRQWALSDSRTRQNGQSAPEPRVLSEATPAPQDAPSWSVSLAQFMSFGRHEISVHRSARWLPSPNRAL